MAQACWPSDRRMWAVDADLPRLECFAALVAAAEREACAKVCDELAGFLACHSDRGGADICVSLSDTLRARGQP